MKKYIVFGLVGMTGFIHQTAYAEVYDLDALTDGYDTVTTITETVEPTALEVSLAECLIYQKLEIDDVQCDKLLSSFSCPDYAKSLTVCEEEYQYCLSTMAAYSGCVANYQSCTDRIATSYNACAKQYPPRKVTGEKVTNFELADASGDVRVFYDDNPTPYTMETVKQNRTIQTGAAIFTGENGSATLVLPNGVTQVVGPNTYFRIADYFTSDRFMDTYTQLYNGNVQVRLGSPDAKQLSYVVITPLWQVKAKGTEFDITVNEDGTQALVVTSGAVELLNMADDTVQTVSAGETITSEESDTDLLDLESDYTLTSKLQHFWFTQRWVIILGGLGMAVLVIGGIIWLVVRRHRS